MDSVRGDGRALYSDAASVESTGLLSSLDNHGFTIKGADPWNYSPHQHVAWCWKAGGAGASNFDGTISSTVSANPDAGFSIVTYTGNHTAGATVGHGLNGTPDLILLKSLDSTTHWVVNSSKLDVDQVLLLNENSAVSTAPAFFNNTRPDGAVFTLGADDTPNKNGDNYVAYCFRSINGVSKVDTYTGDGSIDFSKEITTGFKPAFVMIKRIDSPSDWYMLDSERYDSDLDATYTSLRANSPIYEQNNLFTRFTETGFRFGANDHNYNGARYIYIAFAEQHKPVANAGEEVSVIPGSTVMLDGSASYDPDENYPLAYSWAIVSKPEQSQAVLNDAAGLTPSFHADETGVYIAELIVTDAAGFSSAPVQVLITSTNAVSTAATPSFETVRYTGTDGQQSITNVGFKPDLVWIKDRDGGTFNHVLMDSVRGDGRALFSDLTAGESTGLPASLDNEGFTIQGAGPWNYASHQHVAWCWNAGETSVANIDGTIPSTVSANPDAGFSIVAYTGNYTAGATVGHGLNGTPDLIILKSLDSLTQWAVNSSKLDVDKVLLLNSNAAVATEPAFFNSTRPDDSVFTLGANNTPNEDGGAYIAYCFRSVDGISKIDTYTGDGSRDFSKEITTGFKPAFVMIKRIDSPSDWYMLDSEHYDSDLDKTYTSLRANSPVHEQNNLFTRFTGTGFSFGANDHNYSGAEYIYIAFAEQKPVANAGRDVSVHPVDIAYTVMLDGSASDDPDRNYPLTYSWEIVSKPPGSQATLDGATPVSPSLNADKIGDYYIRLVVTDALGVNSTADHVLVSCTNVVPVADAGDDQAIGQIGTTVHLDGTRSHDGDGDAISYNWAFINKPDYSSASLVGANTAAPSFIADINGEYSVRLIVDDWVSSHSDNINISFDNVAPVADPGNNLSVAEGATVLLDGSGSIDANGDQMGYQWDIAAAPPQSQAALDNPASAAPSFVADVPGTYVIRLIANDGVVDSDAKHIMVVASKGTNPEAVITKLLALADLIIGLDDAVFKHPETQKPNVSKVIGQVIQSINDQDYHQARGKLAGGALLSRIDGCAERGTPDVPEIGTPDHIIDCTAQGQVYPLINEIIGLIDDLILVQ
ncbi:MAG: PKD domain-containing protein [Desulfobacter sp.]